MNDIPPLDPVIKNYITPETKTFENTKPIMKDIRKEFKLIKKLNLVDKQGKKKTIVWKDIIEEINKEESTA